MASKTVYSNFNPIRLLAQSNPPTQEHKATARSHAHKRLSTRYGPWAVVTGTSSGIGREIALQLAKAGLNLVLVARSQQVLEEMAADFATRFSIETQVLAIDLAQETAIGRVEAETDDLDVGLLVAAAGFGTSGPFLNTSLDQELDMLNVNCRALVGHCLHFGQRFAKRGRGGIVLMSSIVGFQGLPNARTMPRLKHMCTRWPKH